jgi:hypothetical protein
VLLVSLALLSPAAQAESKAESCLRTKVWEGYADGWGVRTMTTAELEDGKFRAYLVTLYEGTEYKVRACGDDRIANVDLLLYDPKGNLITRDDTTSREPEFTFKPPTSGTFYVVVYAREVVEAGGKGEVAMAVVYH